MLRKGRNFYGRNYDKAIEMFNSGKPITEISKELSISYSCAYHWIKGLRRPDAGNVNIFEDFINKNGPTAAVEIKGMFPKHNELFLIASRRGCKIKRKVLARQYGEYRTWYFLDGQEDAVEKRILQLKQKMSELKDAIRAV